MIVVVEQNWVGHHPAYFSQMIFSAAKHADVLALCPAPEDAERDVNGFGNAPYSVTYQKLDFDLSEFPIRRKIPALYNDVLFSRVGKAIDVFSSTSGRTEKKQITYVLFCCLYHGSYSFYKKLEQAFPYRWSALMINTEVCEELPWMARVKKWRSRDPLRVYKAQNCQSVLILEHEKRDLVEAVVPVPILEFPEICFFTVADEAEVDETMPSLKAADWPLVGVLGHISSSKCLLELVHAAKSVKNRKWGLLVIGEVASGSFTPSEYQEILEFLEKDPLSLSYLKRIKGEPLYNAILSKISVFFLCYRNFYRSSNNMIKGAHFRKPMIVLDQGCLAMRMDRFGLGVKISDLAATTVVDAIHKLLDGFEMGDCERFLDIHDVSQVSKIIGEQYKLGLQK